MKLLKIVLTNSHHGSENLADGDVEVRILKCIRRRRP